LDSRIFNGFTENILFFIRTIRILRSFQNDAMGLKNWNVLPPKTQEPKPSPLRSFSPSRIQEMFNPFANGMYNTNNMNNTTKAPSWAKNAVSLMSSGYNDDNDTQMDFMDVDTSKKTKTKKNNGNKNGNKGASKKRSNEDKGSTMERNRAKALLVAARKHAAFKHKDAIRAVKAAQKDPSKRSVANAERAIADAKMAGMEFKMAKDSFRQATDPKRKAMEEDDEDDDDDDDDSECSDDEEDSDDDSECSDDEEDESDEDEHKTKKKAKKNSKNPSPHAHVNKKSKSATAENPMGSWNVSGFSSWMRGGSSRTDTPVVVSATEVSEPHYPGLDGPTPYQPTREEFDQHVGQYKPWHYKRVGELFDQHVLNAATAGLTMKPNKKNALVAANKRR
jgi:hypothetical protein